MKQTYDIVAVLELLESHDSEIKIVGTNSGVLGRCTDGKNIEIDISKISGKKIASVLVIYVEEEDETNGRQG